jgi:hypothetical protein
LGYFGDPLWHVTATAKGAFSAAQRPALRFLCCVSLERDFACTAEGLPLPLVARTCPRAAVERERDDRVRVAGASRTGSATYNVRPGESLFDDRWFHARRSSTETPNLSATVTSVSPCRAL